MSNLLHFIDLAARLIEVEQAARAGDTETLRQILTQVLSTDTGQRLAGKVKDAMQDG